MIGDGNVPLLSSKSSWQVSSLVYMCIKRAKEYWKTYLEDHS